MQINQEKEAMTTSVNFEKIAKRVLKQHTELRGKELEDEALSLAYALAETANARIDEANV